MIFRAMASILLLISIIFIPIWWVSVILALAGMIYFAVFWEAIILLLLSDLLYGAKEAKFHGMIFIYFVVGIIVLIIIEFLKKKTRFYS